MTSSLETCVLDRAVSAGVFDIEELLALPPAEDVPPAAGGNGGPEMALDHAAIAAMVDPIFGPRWEGKFAPLINEHARQISRWRLGESSPSERQQGNVREWALMTCQRLLAAVGEDDIAYEVGRVMARQQAVALERGRPGWSETVVKFEARSPEEVERSRLALEAPDAKAEARRAERAARAAGTA